MKGIVTPLFVLSLAVLVLTPSTPFVSAIQLRDGSSLAADGTMKTTLSAEYLSAVQGQPPSTTDGNVDISKSLPEVVDKFKKDYGQLPRWLQIVLCVIAIAIGLLLTFEGYHFFKVSVFLIAGGLVGVIMFVVLDHSVASSVANKAAIVYGVSVGVGLLAGIVAVCLIRPAVFAVGATVGVLLAVFLNPIALKYVWPENPEANLYIWMGVFGVVFGVLVLFLEKIVMIAATAVGGSFLVIVGIGEIVGNLPSLGNNFAKSKQVPAEVWGYLGGWAALGIIGFLVQMLITAKKDDHGTRTLPKHGKGF